MQRLHINMTNKDIEEIAGNITKAVINSLEAKASDYTANNINYQSQNPNQENLNEQDPPPPYSAHERSDYLASAQYRIPGGLNPQEIQWQEYEPVDGLHAPSAPPLDVNAVDAEEKSGQSSKMVLQQLQNSHTLKKSPVSLPQSNRNMIKNAGTEMKITPPSAPVLPSELRPALKKNTNVMEEGEQRQFGNIVIPSLRILRTAERQLVNYLTNKNKREIVGIRYDLKVLICTEAFILLCEKNNIAYTISDNSGTPLDTKYSSHQDPLIKSIFAYLDQHFKPILNQLSQDTLATVVLASDEKEEVKVSVSENGMFKNINVSSKPARARAMVSSEKRLKQRIEFSSGPVPVIAKHPLNQDRKSTCCNIM